MSQLGGRDSLAGEELAEAKKRIEELAASAQVLASALDHVHDIALVVDCAYRVQYVNKTGIDYFERYFGVRLEPGHLILEKVPSSVRDRWKQRYDRALAGEAFSVQDEYDVENVPYCSEVSFVPIEQEGGTCCVYVQSRDITDRKREERLQAAKLRLIEFSLDHSVNELLRRFLDEAEVLTSSEVGFFHFVESDGETLKLRMWSTKTLDGSCKAEAEDEHYPISRAGVWVDCVHERKPVVHNDYESLTHRKGLPEGHVPLSRELVVPVLRGERIVAILGVGNKRSDYDAQDVDVVQRLADLAWETVVRKRAEEQLELFRSMTELGMHGTVIADLEGRLVYVNDYYARVHGHAPEDLLGVHVSVFHAPEQMPTVRRLIQTLQRDGRYPPVEVLHVHKDGTEFPMLMSGILLRDAAGDPQYLAATALDITERKRSEDALVGQQRAIKLNNLIAGVFLTSEPQDVYGAVLELVLSALDSGVGCFGYVDEHGAMSSTCVKRETPGLARFSREHIVSPADAWPSVWGDVVRQKRTKVFEAEVRMPQSKDPVQHAMIVPIVDQDTLIGHFFVGEREEPYDFSERELLEGAAAQVAPVLKAMLEREQQRVQKEELEAKLQQAQKMEAVGRLAGGVAHDFNNVLAAITGHSELVLGSLSSRDPLTESVREIAEAARRGAELTQQLLAFSRRQILDPKVVRLSDQLQQLEPMLRRLIGEDIELRTQSSQSLGLVRVDPNQFEQVVLNLAINARDAMPSGGELCIELAEVTLPHHENGDQVDAVPGDYVVLSVTDTGVGMSEETRQRIFEPFFTTKQVGKGTGLGLATVYGVAKQHGCAIDVSSAPGEGSSFRIFFPKVQGDVEYPEPRATPQPETGQGTVLVVEDDPVLRKVAVRLLAQLGYQAIAAGSPEEAIDLAARHDGHIDLLFTDVVMPGMNGRQLVSKIRQSRPRIGVLFTSGYSDDVIAYHGVLEAGLHFIAKPYTLDALAKRVRLAILASRESP